MYCKKCEAEMPEDSVYCPVCGAKVEDDEESDEDEYSSTHVNYPKNDELEAITILAFIFAFLFPIIGFILGVVSRNKDYGPRNNSFGIASIIIASVILFLYLLLL